MWTREEMAWVAGLFEGEGSISTAGKSTFVLRLAMTDEDVIRRLHRITGVGNVYDKPAQIVGHKHQWIWIVSKQEHLQAMLAAMWPWLCSRRRAKAVEALEVYRRPRQSHKFCPEQLEAVRTDFRSGCTNVSELARRHQMSRTRVRQLLLPIKETP